MFRQPTTIDSIAYFSKIDTYIYPEICKQLFEEATARCTEESRSEQRKIANMALRNIF